MNCKRVGCIGKIDSKNVEVIGTMGRTVLVCPICKLCHEPSTGKEARSKMVPKNVLVWNDVYASEVMGCTVELKCSMCNHSDDDMEWLRWKGLGD